jgi:hypothetical protein
MQRRYLIALMVMAVGCGGGSGGLGTGAISAAQVEPLCAADCQHSIDCFGEDELAECTMDCVDSLAGWARGDAVETLLACSIALPCEESDDVCLLEVEPLAIHQEWEDKCRSTLVTCGVDLDAACEVTATAENEAAGFYRVMEPALMEELIDCLDGVDCTARLQCSQSVLEAHGLRFSSVPVRR